MTDYTGIDPEGGRIDRRIFSGDELYCREVARIFGRCWLFVAHESQIPQPGDFISTYMGEENVLVVRQRDTSIAVLVNACPHRGNRVCHAEVGRTRSFVCNYHGWSFGLDGQLKAVHEAPPIERSPGFDKRRLGMPRAAAVSSYKGLVFATFDPNARPLEDELGEFRWYLDILLDNDPAGTEFLPGAFKNVMRCNWKVPAENFIGDALHAGWTHDSGARAMLGKGVAPSDSPNTYQINVNGHGWQVNLDYPLGNAATLGDKRIVSYLREREAEVSQRLGPLRARMLAAISSATIFPNLSFLPGQSTFRVWHPRGPHEIELHSWVLVNRSAPQEIKDAYRKGVMMTFSPGGLFEMDDGENWEFVTRVSRGGQARRQPLYYGTGLGTETRHPELPGKVFNGAINDANQRAFYRRWLDLMDLPRSEPAPL
ncbi:MAG: Rieske 2Fe-2S domain-containing protein [Proteobacteria bacterium]|nr:Rieske 2Fe-2S domain-containing protein [Pseudomonadota bacterium]